VWFVKSFRNTYPEYHRFNITTINAAEIRKTLGDFSGVAHQPAKYAARMAQAFTATDPSVKIRRDEWEEAPDLGEKPYEHTDGTHTHTLLVSIEF
jgi:RNA-dependent RNA polymerase